MAAEQSPASKIYPALVGVLSCVYHLVVAVSCAYLPDHLLYIRWVVQLYAWAGSACSLVGLGGIVRSNSKKVKAFSRWLLFDTCVQALVRMLLLQLFVGLFNDQNTCSSSPYDPTSNSRNFRYEVVTSIRYPEEDLCQSPRGKRCEVALGVIYVVMVGLLMCMTVAQGTLAIEMRKLGKDLEHKDHRKQYFRGTPKPRRCPEPIIESEKMRLELA